MNRFRALASFLVGMGMSVLVSGGAIAQTVTGNPTALNNIMTRPLTAADMQGLMCFGFYRSVYYASPLSGITDDQICRIISNHATFWSTTTAGVYQLRMTTPSGVVERFYFNPLALLNLNNSLTTGLYGHGTINMPILAVINLDNYTSGGTAVPAFRLPPGYTTATASENILQLIPTSNLVSNRGAIGALRLIRFGNLSTPVTVSFTNTGTATRGTDYTLFPPQAETSNAPNAGTAFTGNSFVFPANSRVVQMPFQSSVPTATQPGEFFSINLSLPSGFGFASAPNAMAYIDEQTIYDLSIGFVGASTVNRGQSTVFRITRTGGNNAQSLTVNYWGTGNATNGTDYALLDGNAVIPAGQASVDIPVSTLVPSDAQPQENAIFALVDTAAYNLSNPSSVNLTLQAFTPSQVSIAAAGSTTLTPGGSNNGFVISRTGDATQAIAVTYTVDGTAQAGVDYSQLPGSATIPAGANSVTVPITIPQRTGTTAIPEKTIQIDLTAGNGYSLSSATRQNLTIPEYTPQLSSITVSAPNGGRLNRGQAGEFIVTRTGGDQTQPLAVRYALAGTAQRGSDYLAPGGATGTLTIDANQSSASFPVSALNGSGNTTIPERSVELVIQSGTGYSGAGQQGAIAITSYTPSTVRLGNPSGGTLTPGAITNAFTVSRTGDASQPLTVSYSVSGTAVPDEDYAALPGAVVIPAGQNSATVRINVPPASGSTAKPERTVAIALDPSGNYAVDSSSGNATYTIPAYTPPTVPQVSFSVPPDSSSTITPATPGRFTVTRAGGDYSQPMTVNYTLNGTAQNGVDYQQLPGSVTIPAGQDSATVPIVVPNNPSADGKAIAINLASGSGYQPDSNTGLTYTIDVPSVPQQAIPISIGSLANPFPSFIANRPAGGSTSPVELLYTISGTAVPGVDYAPLSGRLTIPAGRFSGVVLVQVLPRATAGRTIELSFSAPVGYTVTPSNVSETISREAIAAANSTQPQNPEAPAEQTSIRAQALVNPARFVIVRSGRTEQPLTLRYTTSGTAEPGIDYASLPGTVTIPAGQSSVEIPIRTLPGARPGRMVQLTLENPITGEAVLSSMTLDINLTVGEPPTAPAVPVASESSSGRSSGSSIAPLLGAAGALGGAVLLGGGVDSSTVATCSAFGSGAFASQFPGGVIAQLRQLVEGKALGNFTLRSLVTAEGTAAADQFMLGDLAEAFRSTTLEDVQRMGGHDLSRLTLAAAGLFADTTLGGLIRTLYSGAKTVGEVPGLAEYLVTRQTQAMGNRPVASRQGSGAAITVAELEEFTLEQLLNRYPTLARVNLGGTAIAQVPGLMQMPLPRLPNANETPLSRIPGLDKVPLNQLLPCLAEQARESSGGLTGR